MVADMRILMILSRFFPEPPGGIEVHVGAFSKELTSQGLSVTIAVPNKTSKNVDFGYWSDIPVIRYNSTDPFRNKGGKQSAISSSYSKIFKSVLEKVKPDIVHLHVWDRTAGSVEARIANELSIPLVLTIHHPVIVCPRGSALQWGCKPCPAPLDFRVCISCLWQSRGLPKPLSQILCKLLPSLNAFSSHRLLSCLPLWKVGFSLEKTKTLWKSIDTFIIPSRWIGGMLKMYEIQPDKICYIAQPLCHQNNQRNIKKVLFKTASSSSNLRVGFIGRCRPLKGIDLLVQAVLSIPESMPISLQIYCAGDTPAEIDYLNSLKLLSKADPRICFAGPLAPAKILETMSQWDIVAIPSRVQECAPLVVLEAFAAGIPVVGSDCGGVAEMVRDGVNGLLFKTGDIKSLAKQLTRLCSEPGLLEKLRKGITEVPEIGEATKSLIEVYKRVESRTRRFAQK